MQSLRALKRKTRVPFQDFGKRVEKTPSCTGLKLLMLRLPILVDNLLDFRGRNGPSIQSADYCIVCVALGEGMAFVGGYSQILPFTVVDKFPGRAVDQLWEVSADM